jgi:hypothetical protein
VGKKDKTPTAKFQPGGKTPRAGGDPDDANRQTPVWSVSRFDHDGPWGRNGCSPEAIIWETIFPKMVSYESMTWNDILQNRKYNHSVEVDKMIKAARDRLMVLRMDEYEELFRFRLAGTGRVWGIRDGRVFQILWWDPDHKVCPSTKD